MRYLFDASELTPSSAKSIGIYRYAVGLASSMAQQLKPHEALLITCNGDNLADYQPLASLRGVSVSCLQPGGMPGHLWRQWWMRLGCALFVRRMAVSVYFSPKGFIPRSWSWPGKVRRVCVIHDLIPFWYFERWPGYFGRLESWLVADAFQHAMANADRIIAISSDTCAALVAHGVPAGRVSLVLNGVDQAVAPPPASALPAGVPGRFVFAMASKLPHKNLEGVLAGYAAYRRRAGNDALPLALCGTTDVEQDGVLALGRVSQEALDALYGHASAFLFLSQIEGFGYPPIEALRVGTPVICTNLEVFREVCLDMALYADAGDAEAVAAQLMGLVANPWMQQDREHLMARAHERISKGLEWGQCAHGVLTELREASPMAMPNKEAA